MSNYSKRKTRVSRNSLSGLNKVIYGLLAALIILGLVLGLIVTRNSNGKTEETLDEQETAPKISNNGEIAEEDSSVGNKSLNEDKLEVDVIVHEAARENANSAEEVVSGVVGINLDAAHDSQPSPATDWILITVFILSVAVNGCIALFIFLQTRQSNKLHIERIKLLNDKKYVEPEDLQKTMRDLSEKTRALDKQLSELKQNNQDTVQQLTHQAREAFTKLEKNSASHLESVEELKSAYLLMRDKLDEKDKEIKRYKEGYDTDKLITSLEGFIKIRDRIDSYAEDGKTSKSDLQRVVEIIENTITTIGAKEIDITVGDNINDDKYLTSVSAKKEVDTDNPDDNGKIASIEKNGYQINGPDTSTVIRKAEVALYKYKTNK